MAVSNNRTERPCAFSARPRVLMALEWYDPMIHEGIAQYAKEADWVLDVSMARTNTMPEHWEGDGVISLLNEEQSQLLRYVEALDLPTAGIGYVLQDRYPIILGDHARVGELAAEHFLQRKYRDFAFVFFDHGTLEHERCEGLEQALQRTGTDYRLQRWMSPRKGRVRSYRQVRDWLVSKLEEASTPLAIMAQNDDSAILVLYACIEAGIRVPEQVAVLGADNNHLICDFAPIPLSSVDGNLYGLGYEAARVLDRIINGEAPPEEPVRVSPRDVQLRRSTDMLAIEQPAIAGALRYIWDHFADRINVLDVIARTGMSRSFVYQEFDRALGHSIAKEITRCRIEHACRMLRETENSVNEVAIESGFGSVVSFCRAFARETGKTATEFRKCEDAEIMSHFTYTGKENPAPV
ncbi:xylose operon transcription regulator XylR [Kiritimatiella glycovorans]|uniref:Xylose operon regulatory protein n=1 Tax=Kiritimatiella glycovorans TaxID=1307763 RepID=A0A0G3EGS7_9BACT|nr:DNA-binding transcriptional regulator [Kiritimatiella glycovorans]AKJ65681.1 Xylose operon regulatory protein [Kiritimatiella glycovorans]